MTPIAATPTLVGSRSRQNDTNQQRGPTAMSALVALVDCLEGERSIVAVAPLDDRDHSERSRQNPYERVR